MSKFVLSLVVICGLCLLAGGQSPDLAVDLPALHQIKEATLTPSYSCRSSEEFKKGYEKTSLFLSDFAKRLNSPDLVFNGACGSEDYFQSSSAGTDMSLIADLGANVPLEDLSASRIFNLRRVHSIPEYSKFVQVAKVEPQHTYAVVLNSRDRRGLFVFTVTEYEPNKKVSLRYAVKAYQVSQGHTASNGFSWDRLNTR